MLQREVFAQLPGEHNHFKAISGFDAGKGE
jgi:hypothetical protein